MDAEKDLHVKPNNSNGEHDSQPMEVDVVPLGNQPKPDILKLDIDCFEELFDWLSLVDLHAVGQTCTRLRQYAGFVFRQTYTGAHVECKKGGIFLNDIQINGFCNFVRKILLWDDDLECFHFLNANEFKSVRKITLRYISFTPEKIECIKDILNSAEVVELERCTMGGEFYEKFLQYCPNMKRLSFILPVVCKEPVGQPIIGIDNSWMLREYPKLKYFGLMNVSTPVHRMDELIPFFETNPNIRKFAVAAKYLYHGGVDSNLQFNQFDDVAIITNVDDIETHYDSFHRIPRMPPTRLQLYIDYYEEPSRPINTVDKLHMERDLYENPEHLDHYINLKELHARRVFNDAIEPVATILVNLERISIAEIEQIELLIAFIVRSPKLNTIAIHKIEENEKGAHKIDLVKWNRERGRLPQAQKVTIFVEESVYLAVKRTMRETSYKFVELKRIETCEWSHDFGRRR